MRALLTLGMITTLGFSMPGCAASDTCGPDAERRPRSSTCEPEGGHPKIVGLGRWLATATRDSAGTWTFQPKNTPLDANDLIRGPIIAKVRFAYREPAPGNTLTDGLYYALVGPELSTLDSQMCALVHSSAPHLLLQGASGWQLLSGELPVSGSDATKTGALGCYEGTWVLRVAPETVGGVGHTMHWVYNVNARPTAPDPAFAHDLLVQKSGGDFIVLPPRTAVRLDATDNSYQFYPLDSMPQDQKVFLNAVYDLADQAHIAVPYRYDYP